MSATDSTTESSILGPKGRVVVPERFRSQLGLDEGDEVLFSMTANGALMLLTRQQLVDSLTGAWSEAKSQAGITSLVDELFAERQQDASLDAP